VNGTIKIEMHIPLAWLTLLKEKVQDGLRPVLFIKAAARVL
jgi:hypothetical protein